MISIRIAQRHKKVNMNIALIFAGGTGHRMNTKTLPKQFLELHNKPIIIYTIEQFDNHPDIDAIVIACLEPWIAYLRKLLEKFSIGKVASIVPGGSNGQESIRNGVNSAWELFPEDSIVLVHDGVRPLVDAATISSCIAKTIACGNAITVVPATETIVKESGSRVTDIVDRSECVMAKAPQCFILDDLKKAHDRAITEGLLSFIDSASLMRYYGYELYTVEGEPENIKITTPSDFYIFRALTDARENSQIFG